LSDKIVELHAIIHGTVQGVFFRAKTVEFSEPLGIFGTVSNLSDGTVEIYAHGTQKQLENLLEALQGPGGPGTIKQIVKEYKTPSKLYEDFKIIH
jgi:acylphosphatase